MYVPRSKNIQKSTFGMAINQLSVSLSTSRKMVGSFRPGWNSVMLDLVGGGDSWPSTFKNKFKAIDQVIDPSSCVALNGKLTICEEDNFGGLGRADSDSRKLINASDKD